MTLSSASLSAFCSAVIDPAAPLGGKLKRKESDIMPSGNRIRGMTGFVDYVFPKIRSELVKRVPAYETYCGAGGKTGMDMGGFIIA